MKKCNLIATSILALSMMVGCKGTPEEILAYETNKWKDASKVCGYEVHKMDKSIREGMTGSCVDELICHRCYKENTTRVGDIVHVQRVYPRVAEHTASSPKYVYLQNDVVTEIQY